MSSEEEEIHPPHDLAAINNRISWLVKHHLNVRNRYLLSTYSIKSVVVRSISGRGQWIDSCGELLLQVMCHCRVLCVNFRWLRRNGQGEALFKQLKTTPYNQISGVFSYTTCAHERNNCMFVNSNQSFTKLGTGLICLSYPFLGWNFFWIITHLLAVLCVGNDALNLCLFVYHHKVFICRPSLVKTGYIIFLQCTCTEDRRHIVLKTFIPAAENRRKVAKIETLFSGVAP